MATTSSTQHSGIQRRRLWRFCGGFALLAGLTGNVLAQVPPRTQPNIQFISCDDQAYQAPRAYGQTVVAGAQCLLVVFCLDAPLRIPRVVYPRFIVSIKNIRDSTTMTGFWNFYRQAMNCVRSRF